MYNEAPSLHLRYGLDIALSTLNSCRYLHEPKTRFPVEWLCSFPGRESHPLEAPGLAWRTEELLQVDVHHPMLTALHVRLRSTYRIQRALAWPETETARRERWLEDRL